MGTSAQCTIKIVILKKSFSEKTALSRMAKKSSSSELGCWVDRVPALLPSASGPENQTRCWGAEQSKQT